MKDNFLLLAHSINPVDFEVRYFLFDGAHGIGIYSQMISMEGQICHNEEIKFIRSTPQNEHPKEEFLRDFCKDFALHSDPFSGSFKFISSSVVTQEEFESWQDERSRKRNEIRLEAERNKSEIISELKRLNRFPYAPGIQKNIWHAQCVFSKGNHFMYVDTDSNICSCAWCKKRITLDELRMM